jgi:hypothetical protein
VKSELCILVLFLFLLFLSISLLTPYQFSTIRQTGLVPPNTIITADNLTFLTIYGAFSV